MRYIREHGGPYRARDGKFLGVCKGLAQHFGLGVTLVRAGVVLAAVFTAVGPVLALYVLAAIIMNPEPVIPVREEHEREFYDSWANSRTGAVDRLKRRFENLDRRIRRMEDVVTSREFEWDQRFKR